MSSIKMGALTWFTPQSPDSDGKLTWSVRPQSTEGFFAVWEYVGEPDPDKDSDGM
jgi:hypothetical protein